MTAWLSRLSDDHGITALALVDQPIYLLIDRLFLRLLTRTPSPKERQTALARLRRKAVIRTPEFTPTT